MALTASTTPDHKLGMTCICKSTLPCKMTLRVPATSMHTNANILTHTQGGRGKHGKPGSAVILPLPKALLQIMHTSLCISLAGTWSFCYNENKKHGHVLAENTAHSLLMRNRRTEKKWIFQDGTWLSFPQCSNRFLPLQYPTWDLITLLGWSKKYLPD